MKVLVTGSGGQLGTALGHTVPLGIDYIGLDRSALDVGNSAAIRDTVTAIRPDWIINTAAYTHVDRAETERDAAYRLNTEAPRLLAETARELHIRLLHLSTDFVFDGTQGAPYSPDAVPHPVNVYGQTKLGGERAVLETLETNALIVRTAWLYATHGRNFVRAILERARMQDQIRVVCDQIGTPTWVHGLATALWKMVEKNLSGTHHWTDAGVASWYDLAVAILEESHPLGLIDRVVPVIPIPSDAFPSKAKRPPYSVLDKTVTWSALSSPGHHWRTSLRMMLRELQGA